MNVGKTKKMMASLKEKYIKDKKWM